MRAVSTEDITANIKEMCIEANHYLSDDMACLFERAVEEEQSPLGRQVLGQLKENLAIAGEDMIPICQDTGCLLYTSWLQWYLSSCFSLKL